MLYSINTCLCYLLLDLRCYNADALYYKKYSQIKPGDRQYTFSDRRGARINLSVADCASDSATLLISIRMFMRKHMGARLAGVCACVCLCLGVRVFGCVYIYVCVRVCIV